MSCIAPYIWKTFKESIVFTAADNLLNYDRQGCSYIYAKRKCVHIWNKHMRKFYRISNGFLMLSVQNMCVEPILISLNPILTEFL